MNYKNQALRAYQTNAVETQTQGSLIVMLYDGAIKFIDQGIEFIEKKNIQKAHENIVKAQKIVNELMCTLNMAAGPIAKELFDLYEFMYFQLIQANLKKDIQPLNDVKNLLMDLRGAWKEIA